MNLLNGIFFHALLCGALFLCISAKPRHRRLSDIVHHPDSKSHDTRFDHDAFLGREEASKFDELSPEESGRRLGQIFDQIDNSMDGFVTFEELQAWIERVHVLHMRKEAEREFREYGGEDGQLPFDVYSKEAHVKEENTVPEDLHLAQKQVARDKKKWAAADENKDGVLSFNEFIAFSNPVEFPHMHQIHIGEAMEEFDTDGNNRISYDEFRKNRWRPNAEEKEPPQWLEDELQTMIGNFDQDGDGSFDREEVGEWLIPSGHDPYQAEAEHLISQGDDDRDGKLSKDEVLQHQDLFVGSKATAYGRVFHYHHEL